MKRFILSLVSAAIPIASHAHHQYTVLGVISEPIKQTGKSAAAKTEVDHSHTVLLEEKGTGKELAVQADETGPRLYAGARIEVGTPLYQNSKVSASTKLTIVANAASQSLNRRPGRRS